MCVALPVRVVDIEPGVMPMGTVESAGTRLPCCFAYVPQAQVGDYVIMQNGFAIEVLDPASAAESLAIHAEFSTASANEDDSST